MRKSTNKLEMQSKVKELLLDSKWRSNTWKFIDSNNLMNPDVKNRDATKTDADLAAELHVLSMMRLENLIEKRVKITKKNIGFGNIVVKIL